MAKQYIVVDLDGTLCDCSHRIHWAQAKDWDLFNGALHDDEVITQTVKFIQVMSFDHNILLCTGRDDSHRIATEKWLYEKGVAPFVNHLLMRPHDDFRSDHVVKVELVYDFFKGKEQALSAVSLVLDDRDRVVEEWRNQGFTCWQVAAGNY